MCVLPDSVAHGAVYPRGLKPSARLIHQRRNRTGNRKLGCYSLRSSRYLFHTLPGTSLNNLIRGFSLSQSVMNERRETRRHAFTSFIGHRQPPVELSGLSGRHCKVTATGSGGSRVR